jgi:lysophospholipase L1-like esterase
MRKHLICLLLFATVANMAFADEPSPQKMHLFILSGQSNMAKLDPGISFTPTVTKALAEDQVIVVKDAEGGQPIRRWYKDWKPASGENRKPVGDLYDRLMEKVKAALDGKKPDTITFLWMQGERDAREKNGAVYGASLKGLLDQLAQDLQREDISVVIGRLSDHGVDNPEIPDWNVIRETQGALAEANPRWEWVDTDDLNGPDDNLHLTKDGYRILGERFAEAALKLIAKPQ